MSEGPTPKMKSKISELLKPSSDPESVAYGKSRKSLILQIGHTITGRPPAETHDNAAAKSIATVTTYARKMYEV